MAELKIADNDCLYIKLDIKEATKIGFGFQTLDSLITGCNICVCGSCNGEIRTHMYYVCCINEVLCEDCFNDYVKSMAHYTNPTDIKYEIQHAQYYCDKLGLNVNIKLDKNRFIINKRTPNEGK